MDKLKITEEKLIRHLHYDNKASYIRALYDAERFNMLLTTIGKKTINIVNPKNFSIKESSFVDYVDVFLKSFKPMVSSISDLFSKYPAQEREDELLPKDDVEKIVYNFLEQYLKPLIDIYDELKKEKHILIKSLNGDYVAYAYTMPYIQEDYILLSKKTKSLFRYMYTIAHELMHVYNSRFLSNYRISAFKELNAGFKGETLSIYTELLFHKFLEDEKLFIKENMIEKNYLLFSYDFMNNSILQFLIANELKEQGLEVDIDFQTFTDYTLETPYFDASGSLVDLNYILGTTEAYMLYKKTLEEEDVLKIVNDYLISLQDLSCYKSLINNEYDYGFIKKELKKNYNNMKKMSN